MDIAIDLDRFVQPEGSDLKELTRALSLVQIAIDEKAAWDACNKLEWAFGNPHCGTFCPIALGILEHLEACLRSGVGVWPMFAVLNILGDLAGSWEPESEYRVFEGALLKETVVSRIGAMRPLIESISLRTGPEAEAAAEVLECLDSYFGA